MKIKNKIISGMFLLTSSMALAMPLVSCGNTEQKEEEYVYPSLAQARDAIKREYLEERAKQRQVVKVENEKDFSTELDLNDKWLSFYSNKDNHQPLAKKIQK